MPVPSEDWQPQGVDKLEPRAWDALRETAQSVCVTAGAGAGKTEFLAQKAAYLLQTGLCPEPKRILAISFKRDAAQNLAARVGQRCPANQTRRFHSMTFDAFTKHMLDHFRLAIPDAYRPRPTTASPFPHDKTWSCSCVSTGAPTSARTGLNERSPARRYRLKRTLRICVPESCFGLIGMTSTPWRRTGHWSPLQ